MLMEGVFYGTYRNKSKYAALVTQRDLPSKLVG